MIMIEPVDPDPDPSCGRHSLADGLDEFFIQGASLFVAGFTPLVLLLEEPPLDLGVVELAIGIADLLRDNEAFKALDQPFFPQAGIAVGFA